MEELAGDAHISFEGNLHGLRLLGIPGASEEETDSLKRNTSWPKQDFAVVPLESDSSGTILAAIGGALPRKIIHVQIEKAGLLEFGAYDGFGPGCITFGSAVSLRFLESLISRSVIKTLQKRPVSRDHSSKSS
jgi:hypothetical protein